MTPDYRQYRPSRLNTGAPWLAKTPTSLRYSGIQVFSQQPLTAYKRQTNIRDHLIRARVPTNPKTYPERNRKGMKNAEETVQPVPISRK